MAAGSLLALIDDIASILDDVALMSKVAAKKTAGVLGDDLALNAEQLGGVRADRELPVVWAVGVGSLKNKAVLVPAALALSAFAPWAVAPLLMAGGVYLCYEGVEKLAHAFGKGHADAGHGDAHDGGAAAVRGSAAAHAHAPAAATSAAAATPAAADADPLAAERDKIKGAIRTDFVLSAEIIVIALGTVVDASFGRQVAVLVGIALLMTVGVYGLVAAIVKLDDAGLYLSQRGGAATRALGRLLLGAAPLLMKTLSVAGTIAVFTVGGGILVHGIHPAHAFAEGLATRFPALPAWLLPNLAGAALGVLAGCAALAVVALVQRLRREL
jgi:predicted DNA repair protein MutK